MIGLGSDKNPKLEGSITASHVPKLESWTYLNWSEILRSNTLIHGFLVRGSALLHFPPGCGKAVTHSFLSNWKPRRPNASHMQVYVQGLRHVRRKEIEEEVEVDGERERERGWITLFGRIALPPTPPPPLCRRPFQRSPDLLSMYDYTACLCLICQDGGWESIQITVESLQRYSRKVRKGSLSSTMMDLQPSSLNQTTNLAECAVCHQVLSERYESSVQIGKRSYIFVDTEKHWKSVFLQPIPKGRVHYGGVSCYSCRAFFRWAKSFFQTRTCLENLWGVQIVIII